MRKCFFRMHGGKYYLAKWILENAPPDYQTYNYIEGFGGAANVLLQKKPSPIEFYFEKNYEIYKIFYFLVCDFNRFHSMVEVFSACERDFLIARENMGRDDIYGAACSYVVRQLCFGTRCEIFCKTNRIRGGRNELENRFENNKFALLAIKNRLNKVVLSNDNIFLYIPGYGPNDFLYLDPPYVHSTRCVKQEYGMGEMGDNDHELLCDMINVSSAKILLSGYDNEIYRRKLKNWNMVSKVVASHNSTNKKKKRKIECLWKNY